MADDERKGLRFEVEERKAYTGHDEHAYWYWTYVGADGPICRSVETFKTEKLARSNIAASKNRLKAARFAKTITVE